LRRLLHDSPNVVAITSAAQTIALRATRTKVEAGLSQCPMLVAAGTTSMLEFMHSKTSLVVSSAGGFS
jgi:hypothetical protein